MTAVSAPLKEYTFTDFCLDMSHPLMCLTIESPAIIILFFLSELGVDLGLTLAELSVTVTLVLPFGTSFDFEASFSCFLSLVLELCLVSLPDGLRLWLLLVFGLVGECLTGVSGLVIRSSSFSDLALTPDSFVVLGIELSATLSGLDFFRNSAFLAVITKKRNDPKPAETSPSHQILTETRPSLTETSGNNPLPPKTG